MAEYVNTSARVIHAGGVMMTPGQPVELESTEGLEEHMEAKTIVTAEAYAADQAKAAEAAPAAAASPAVTPPPSVRPVSR